jgi:hypothetical protein
MYHFLYIYLSGPLLLHLTSHMHTHTHTHTHMHERPVMNQFNLFHISEPISLIFFTGSYSLYRAPGLFLSSVIIFYTDGRFLGWVISLSQGRHLYTGQHKHRINAYTDNHALREIWTPNPSVWASEDSSCHRPRGHWSTISLMQNVKKSVSLHLMPQYEAKAQHTFLISALDGAQKENVENFVPQSVTSTYLLRRCYKVWL